MEDDWRPKLEYWRHYRMILNMFTSISTYQQIENTSTNIVMIMMIILTLYY